jgi:hypothetical protein
MPTSTLVSELAPCLSTPQVTIRPLALQGSLATPPASLTGIALTSNADGIENEAFGDRALRDNVSGSHNTAMGDDALLVSTGDSNTAMGKQAGNGIIDGTNDVALGAEAGTGIKHASDVIAINVPGVSSVFGDASNTCYIGSIYNEPIGGAGTPHAVFVDADGGLGFNPSTRRVKHDIQPMDEASETLYALKPVTFKYKSDKKGMTQFGLIAEEVAEVNPDLVLHDKDGNAESFRYEQIDAMLLNEFLKEHKKVEAQQATIAELQSTVAQQQKGMEVLTAQLKEQAAQIQKVSAQLEVGKPAEKVVLKNP